MEKEEFRRTVSRFYTTVLVSFQQNGVDLLSSIQEAENTTKLFDQLDIQLTTPVCLFLLKAIQQEGEQPITPKSLNALSHMLRPIYTLLNRPPNETKHLNIGFPLLVATKNVCCLKNQHTTKTIKGTTCAVGSNILRIIPLQRCTTCSPSLYFVHKDTLELLEAAYGKLQFNHRYNENMAPYIRLQQNEASNYRGMKTALGQFDYSVDKKVGYVTAQRQYILRDIIASKKMTRTEVIAELERLIAMGKRNYPMEDAVEKWREDLTFVHDKVSLSGADKEEHYSYRYHAAHRFTD